MAIAALSSHSVAQAELIKDGIWKISAGDNIDSILQSVLPNDKHRHPRLKKLATRLNKKAFAADGQLIAGKTLRLPGTKMPDQTPVNSKKIGRVLISNGQLAAKQKDGSSRSLKRGSSIYEGDTVETKTGRSQLRFSDGSLVALRPNTSFKVEEYNYAGQQDGSEKGVYNLLRGGFRTISGAIGKLNKQNYRVKTPVATIGIRGTHYGLTVCEGGSCKGDGLDDGLYGGVVDGSIVTQNRSGESTFNNDEYFSIASIDAKPVSLLAPPGIVFGQSKQEMKKNKAEKAKGKNKAQAKRERLKSKPNASDALVRKNRTERDGANPDQHRPRTPPLDPSNPPPELVFGPTPTTKPPKQGTRAPANARVHVAFLTKDTANPITQEIEDLHVAFQLSQQSTNSSEVGEIYTAQTPNGGDALTYMGFSETESVPGMGDINLVREFFAPEQGNLKDIGFSSANGLDVSWGRWDNAVVSTSINSSDKAINIPTQGLHYIYSDNSLASPAQLQALHSGGAVPNTITLNYAGGTSPTDLNGNVGAILPGFTNMTLDLTNGDLAAYNIKATFATGETYALQLKDALAIPLNSIIGPGNGIKLDGTCYNGGACPTSIPLSGNATADFLIGTGNTVNSISSYAVNDSESNATVGITGTLLLSGGGGG